MPFQLVDSHIHLFPANHVQTLAWHKEGNPLNGQYSVDEYRTAVESIADTKEACSSEENRRQYSLRGFIFIETDRISSLDDTTGGWKHALAEVSLGTRLMTGSPLSREEDGFAPADSRLCLGLVPWAPVPLGLDGLEKYFAELRKATKTSEAFKKIRGVRYLAQDKPPGTMGTDSFIDGVKLLGRKRLVFEVGVTSSLGFWQLKEADRMMDDAHRFVPEEDQTVFVINHLCKPNLRIPDSEEDISEAILNHIQFRIWKSCVSDMAIVSKAYMKLSGAFSEMPALGDEKTLDYDKILERLEPWTDVIFDKFGPERVLFGSDWPICNVGGGGNAVAWQRWVKIVAMIMERRGMTEEHKAGVWGNNAIKAYGLELDDEWVHVSSE